MPAIGARTTGGSATTRSDNRSGAAVSAVMPAPSAAGQLRRQIALDLVDRDPLLLHRVALADGHRVVVEGVEINGYAERRADLILTSIPPADRLRIVEVHVPALAQ